MLILLGCSHRSAPVEIRERMALPEGGTAGSVLRRIVTEHAVTEGLILSTCNRVEIIARTEDGARVGLESLRRWFVEERGLSAEELDRNTYQLSGPEVVRHLFRVASSLDSMIVGEPQVLGQVKAAYRLAREHGATGPVLERLLQHAFATAKRVRTETEIARNAVSVAFAAVELGRRIFGELAGRRALLLGAGKMADLVAKHLRRSGVEDITVASRTYNSAAALAQAVGGRAAHWDDGLIAMRDVDIVVASTGASRPVVGREDVAVAMRGRRSGPLFLIDIAVPRDIEPGANDLDNVYLYDIDGLQNVVDSNIEERNRASAAAERLVEVEVGAFEHWRRSQNVAPVIVDLRETLLGIGRAEVERFRRRLGPMTENQERAVRELTRSVIQKILHSPIRHLRDSVDSTELDDHVSLYRRIFGIEAGSRPEAGSAETTETGEAELGDEAPARDSDRPSDDEPGRGPRRILRGGKKD